MADTPMLEQETFVMYNNSVEEAANGDVIDKQYAPIKDAKNWSIEIPENAKEAVYVMNSGLDRRHILPVSYTHLPEEYDALVQQIISDLYNYRDPRTGKRVFAFAMTREEM